MNEESVTCCFCAMTLGVDEAVELHVLPTPERDESQGLYAHRTCLTARLHPTVPRHPALEPE